MKQSPYNLVAHDFWINQGFLYDHISPEWEDVGDAENGPSVNGHCGYDTYSIDLDRVGVSERQTLTVYISEEGTTEYELEPIQSEEELEYYAKLESGYCLDRI